MFTHTIQKLPKQTIEIIVKIPKSDIAQEYESAFKKLQNELTIEGFRKGKVPTAIAKKHIKNDSVYQELISTLLPKLYGEIIKKENFKPVINPKVELIKAKENEDWEIKMTIAEKPIIELDDYKKIIQKVKEDQKKESIWVPGKDKAPDEKDKEQKNQKLMNEILSSLLKESKIEISDLILEEELNQRLTRLVDDIQKIGLTTDAYLKSKNLTMDTLKEKYRQEIIDMYKLELMLMHVADLEKVEVKQVDLDTLFKNIKDEKERKTAQSNAYMYASILRKQKTLDLLLTL